MMKQDAIGWSIILGVVAFGIFCISLPLAIWKDLLQSLPMLKILELILSWPVATLTICLVFIFRFQAALDQFIRNVKSVKFPGGNVQMNAESLAGGVGAENIVLTPVQRDQLINHIVEVEQQHRQATTSADELRTQCDAARTAVFLWKFNYLNLFYVQGTKQVLNWFAHTTTQSRQSYHLAWQEIITDVNQRGIILEVLLQYGMLSVDGTNLLITPEGYGFLQFIGMIPYAPPQQGN